MAAEITDRKSGGGHWLIGRRGLIGLAIVVALFLSLEHRAHLSELLPYLPWLLVAACPLMHIFMHRGHGGHGHKSGDKKQ